MHGLAQTERWILVVALLVDVLLTAVNVFSRKILHFSFSWSEEVVLALIVLAYMLGAALCSREEGGLINMTIFTGKMSRKAQLITELVMDALLIAFGVMITISGWERCMSKITSGQITASLGVPDWIYNAFIPLGSVFLVIHTIERIVDVITELKGLKVTDNSVDTIEGGNKQ